MLKQKHIVEKGKVKSINGGCATVEIIKSDPEACKTCGVCAGIESPQNLLVVKAIDGLNVGQEVTLQIIEHSAYKNIILLLFLPVFNLLIGGLIGQKLQFIYPYSQDIRMMCCGFIFFLLSIVILSIYDKRLRNRKQTRQKIISIL